MADTFSAPVERAPAKRSATFISGFTLAGRVAERLGAFGQIAVIASVYGSGFLADRYFIASIAPLIIGAISGEALSANILPALVRSPGDDRRLVAAGLWLAAALLVVVTLAYLAAATVVVRLAAPAGSSGLGVWYAFAPIGVFLGLAGYLSGALMYFERFVWPPFRSAVATVGGLAFILLAVAFTHDLIWVAAASTAGYALAFVALIFELRRVIGRSALTLPPRSALAQAFSLRGGLTAPVIGGLLGGQVFVLIERLLASTIGVGAVSTLSYARGVVFTPTILSQSIALGIYPGMVRSYEARDHDHVRGSFERGLRVTLFFTIVLASFFALFGRDTIQVLLERGAFNPQATSEAGTVLSVFSLALAGTMLMIFVARVFYAVDYFRAIVWTQVVALAVYLVVAFPLRGAWGTSGLALAFGLAEVVGALYGLTVASRRIGLAFWTAARTAGAPALVRAIPVVVSLVAARLVGLAEPLASHAFLRLLFALVVGAAMVAVVLWSSGWPELRRIKRSIRRLAPAR